MNNELFGREEWSQEERWQKIAGAQPEEWAVAFWLWTTRKVAVQLPQRTTQTSGDDGGDIWIALKDGPKYRIEVKRQHKHVWTGPKDMPGNWPGLLIETDRRIQALKKRNSPADFYYVLPNDMNCVAEIDVASTEKTWEKRMTRYPNLGENYEQEAWYVHKEAPVYYRLPPEAMEMAATMKRLIERYSTQPAQPSAGA